MCDLTHDHHHAIPHTHALREPSLRRVLADRAMRILRRLLLWNERAQQRRILRLLGEHQLDDIGIDREKALAEARKPSWKP